MATLTLQCCQDALIWQKVCVRVLKHFENLTSTWQKNPSQNQNQTQGQTKSLNEGRKLLVVFRLD